MAERAASHKHLKRSDVRLPKRACVGWLLSCMIGDCVRLAHGQGESAGTRPRDGRQLPH
jgi:hypothetical protein